MVTYDQYDQPDYFYDTDIPGTGSSRLRFIQKPLQKLKRSKKDNQ
jgi:hypothetical protein